jgi:hypothetical protein
MGIRDLLFIGVVVGGAGLLGVSLYPPRLDARNAGRPARPSRDDGLRETVRRVDAAFRHRWAEDGLTPARPAPGLAVVRRLALALTGMIPSLEELRGLESVPEGERAARYVDRLLTDRRFADYFAERLARAYVGTEAGPFLIYRRRRFVSWLSDRLLENRPYDRVVRELIATNGLWTDRPATNFLTVTYDPDKKAVDAERVAGRVSRAFLGARIDCAQCHDHPFAPWTQRDFQGLAAFFGQARSGLTGIHDEARLEFSPTDRKTGKPVVVAPRVPFQPDLLPGEGQGKRRERVARWVTDPRNPSLARATVNRVWALLLGRPLVEPVDDLATVDELPEPLTILADDFVAHGHDLHRLVRAIAATEVFRLDSAYEPDSDADAAEKAWAVFPMTRLRPEQVVGALIQAASLTTIDADSPILVRIARSFGQQAFLKRFGDSGEDEFDARGVTIPQSLLLMNGDLVRDKTKPDLFNAASRIGSYAPTDRAAVEVLYLTTLTREPTAEESRHFEAGLAGTSGKERGARMSDLAWTLVNATEFSWNH